MIDKKYQHQGFGTIAINKALSMMKNNEFKLEKAHYCGPSYEPENQLGKKLYNRIGLIENGEMCDNEIIAIYDLAK